jgi:hypothetical protein
VACTALAVPGPASAAPAGSGTAPVAPAVAARAAHKRASQLAASGKVSEALAALEDGLASAPGDLSLLFLKGRLLLKLRDYPGSFAAYEAYLAAGATGANRRDALRILDDLRPAQTTFLEISLASGAATIYLDTRTLGAWCSAAPTCRKAMLPGTYNVIAERTGFVRWSRSVAIEPGQTTRLAIELVEQPSQLTVRAAPSGAVIAVDGAAYDAPIQVAAGRHRITASLAGHAKAQREIVAHEGEPVAVELALLPLVPVRVSPAGATLALDDAPIAVADGGLDVPAGAHTLVARAAGFAALRIAIPAERGADYQITVELVRAPVDAPPSSRWTARRRAALAAGGVGIAAAAVGAVLGLQSTGLEHDAYALCPSPSQPCSRAPDANATFERGRSRAIWANAGYGLAAGAAITAAVLWLTGAPESRVTVAARTGAGTGFDVAVRF